MVDETAAWSYVPLGEFQLPSPPANDAARGHMRRLFHFLSKILGKSEATPDDESARWGQPSFDRIKSVSPKPDWNQVASRLSETIGSDWFGDSGCGPQAHVFIGAPGSGIIQTLLALAEQKQLPVVTAPARESIFRDSDPDGSAAQALDKFGEAILVIPDLHRWYVRHADGFLRLRELLERLTRKRARAVIGCDSWAWAFLQIMIGIEDRLGKPKTLASFDQERLDNWFRAVLDLQQYNFRECGGDDLVFPERASNPAQGSKEEPREYSSYISNLSAKSRGNVGIAVALWQASLRTYDTQADNSRARKQSDNSSLWVVSPSELEPLQVPDNFDRVHRFILHAILLHGGLSTSTLVALLPYSADDIARRVSTLLNAGILEDEDDELRIRLTAYPLVRQDLQSDGFLTDAI